MRNQSKGGKVMKLAVFGANEIGLTASAVFASHEYKVVCIDQDRDQITALNSGDCWGCRKLWS